MLLSDPQNKPSVARDTITEVIDTVSQKRGIKRTFEDLVSDDAWERRMAEMRVLDSITHKCY